MASALYQIRYINENKRWGLFAKEKIETGTKIFQEVAVMLNASKLKDLISLWDHAKPGDMTLHETARSDLENQTQSILYGMQDFREHVKDVAGYRLPIEIQKKRMTGNEIYKTEDGINTAIHRYPQLQMDLYKQTITETESTEDISAGLKESLQHINVYLQGVVEVRYPDLQAWGPTTALINHGCTPNAVISRHSLPNPTSSDLRNIGELALHAVTTIEKGQEITIEYAQIFGTLEQRRELLRNYGIANCHCATCEHEESLIQQSEEHTAARIALHALNDLNNKIYFFFTQTIQFMMQSTPAIFYQTLHDLFENFVHINYHGYMIFIMYDFAIQYAQSFNDNVRIYWFAVQVLGYVQSAVGQGHTMYKNLQVGCLQGALAGTVWNEERRDMLTLVSGHECSRSDAALVFMLHQPSSSTTYHQLAISPTGQMEPVSRDDNLARVRQALAPAPAGEVVEGAEEEEEAAAAAAADSAAAALAAEEAASASKKDKARAKKKAKKERKRAAAAEAEKEEREKEERLAARVAAVRAAVVVPALPRPRPHPVPPPSPPPHHRRFRSSSGPEPAVVARFLTGVPIRPAPETFGDTVSESGEELRFGVRV